eukprot:3253728-Rhodomonas_salina.1
MSADSFCQRPSPRLLFFTSRGARNQRAEMRCESTRFKAVTMKDPLKRIYATKLKEEAPTVGSSEAIRRPGQPAPAGQLRRDKG